MIQRLGETLTSGLNLLEAEGRLARLHAARFTAGALTLCALVSTTLIGALSAIVGATWLLATQTGVPAALLITGGLLALTAGLSAWGVARRIQ